MTYDCGYYNTEIKYNFMNLAIPELAFIRILLNQWIKITTNWHTDHFCQKILLTSGKDNAKNFLSSNSRKKIKMYLREIFHQGYVIDLQKLKKNIKKMKLFFELGCFKLIVWLASLWRQNCFSCLFIGNIIIFHFFSRDKL